MGFFDYLKEDQEEEQPTALVDDFDDSLKKSHLPGFLNVCGGLLLFLFLLVGLLFVHDFKTDYAYPILGLSIGLFFGCVCWGLAKIIVFLDPARNAKALEEDDAEAEE